MILGPSGDGKSTALIVPPDGTLTEEYVEAFMKDIKEYKGLDPETTVIFNADGKGLPFPYTQLGWKEGVNLFTSTFDKPLTAALIEKYLEQINKGTKIKRVIIDTMNGSMNDKEMLDTAKMTFDKWADLAKDYYRMCVKANSMREDLIIYLFGHTVLTTQQDGNELRHLVTNGKKLEKIHLETKIPIVLHTVVEAGQDGANTHQFETKKNQSSAKTPVGMFKDFLIPNSLKLVDDTIRKYYGLS